MNRSLETNKKSDKNPVANQAAGLVNHILTQSFVDGPGNRAVVFLQECNLHCLYCHNPFTINLCNSCGQCVPTCPTGALRLVDDLVIWDEAVCSGCDTCIKICPRSSSPKARRYTAEALWRAIQPAATFLSGVSISGGEPSLQAGFLAEFFEIVKSNSSLTTLIETNGYAGPEAYAPLMDRLDLALVDLKIIDPAKHRQLTGGDNRSVLQTIRHLFDRGKLAGVNEVVVPGFHTEQDIAGAAGFLAGLSPTIPFRLLRFRPHGTTGPALDWQSPADEEMDRLVQLAQQQGLQNVSRSL